MKFSKALAVFIAVLLLSGSPLVAFAGSASSVPVTVSIDRTTAGAGESVTLSFSFGRAVEDVSSFSFYVGYDESVFSYDTSASGIPEGYYENCNQNPYTVAYNEQTPEKGVAKFGFAHVSAAAAAFDGSDDYAEGVFYRMVFTVREDIEGAVCAEFDLNLRGTAMMTYVLEDGKLLSVSNEASLTVNGVEAGKGGDANKVTVEITLPSGSEPSGTGDGGSFDPGSSEAVDPKDSSPAKEDENTPPAEESSAKETEDTGGKTAEESGEKDPAEPEAKAKGFGKTAAYLAAAFIAVLALALILKGTSKKRKKKH